jgi:hypothetical protein
VQRSGPRASDALCELYTGYMCGVLGSGAPSACSAVLAACVKEGIEPSLTMFRSVMWSIGVAARGRDSDKVRGVCGGSPVVSLPVVKCLRSDAAGDDVRDVEAAGTGVCSRDAV